MLTEKWQKLEGKVLHAIVERIEPDWDLPAEDAVVHMRLPELDDLIVTFEIKEAYRD